MQKVGKEDNFSALCLVVFEAATHSRVTLAASWPREKMQQGPLVSVIAGPGGHSPAGNQLTGTL